MSVPMPKPLIVQPQPPTLHRTPQQPQSSTPPSSHLLPSNADVHTPPDLSWERGRAAELGFFRDDLGHGRTTVAALLRAAEKHKREEEKQSITTHPPHPTAQRVITSSYIPPPPRSSFLTPSTTAPSHSSPSSSDPLISSLTQRLLTLEALTSQQSLAIQQRDERIATLQQSLAMASAPLVQAAAAGKEMEGLRAEYERLSRQVKEMEQFLQDYGLQWVGEEAATAATPPPVPSSPSPLPFPLDVFLARVAQLNASLPSSSLTISRSSSSATFTPPPSLHLVLLSNGFALPCPPLPAPSFLPYPSPAAAALAADILDGYFPTAWKPHYPDGIHIHVDAQLHSTWEEEDRRRREERRKRRIRSFHAFEGEGRRVREISRPASPSTAPRQGGRVEGMGGEGRKRREGFLSRLPVTTVANGAVVPVRAAVTQMLPEREAGPSVWDAMPLRATAALDALRRVTARLRPPFPSALPLYALHVHWQWTRSGDEGGVRVGSFLALFKGEETVLDVWGAVGRYVVEEEGMGTRKWRVRWASVHPRLVVEMDEAQASTAGSVHFDRIDGNASLQQLRWASCTSLFVHARSG